MSFPTRKIPSLSIDNFSSIKTRNYKEGSLINIMNPITTKFLSDTNSTIYSPNIRNSSNLNNVYINLNLFKDNNLKFRTINSLANRYNNMENVYKNDPACIESMLEQSIKENNVYPIYMGNYNIFNPILRGDYSTNNSNSDRVENDKGLLKSSSLPMSKTMVKISRPISPKNKTGYSLKLGHGMSEKKLRKFEGIDFLNDDGLNEFSNIKEYNGDSPYKISKKFLLNSLDCREKLPMVCFGTCTQFNKGKSGDSNNIIKKIKIKRLNNINTYFSLNKDFRNNSIKRRKLRNGEFKYGNIYQSSTNMLIKDVCKSSSLFAEGKKFQIIRNSSTGISGRNNIKMLLNK